MIYKVLIEGQTLDVSEEVATSDERVKDMLKPFWPDVVNAAITRQTKDDVTTINVVKRAGTKGLFPGPLEALLAAPAGENPVVVLARELDGATPQGMSYSQQIKIENRVEKTIEEGEKQNQAIKKAFERLTSARGRDVGILPPGF